MHPLVVAERDRCHRSDSPTHAKAAKLPMSTTESIRHDCLAGTLSRREIILDCTATIAMSGEYDAVQMRAIADRAGMAVGTLIATFRRSRTC